MLRHLRFFTAVADARHFGDASRDLGMTQPPLSQGIQRLERKLGVRLFERDARSVRITAAGQALLPAARDLLRLEEEFVAQAKDLEVPNQVRLGLAGDLDDLVTDLVSATVSIGAEIAPTIAGSVELVDLMREGMLDIAVVRHPGVFDGLRSGPVLVVPTHLEPTISNATIAHTALPVAVAPRHHQPPAHHQLVDALRRIGHSGAVLEAADSSQRRALAAAGVAVRLAPGAPYDASCPPLRMRVVMPLPANQRPGVDHDAVQAALEQVLTP